jgi:N-acetylneuraminic acid mutarotase
VRQLQQKSDHDLSETRRQLQTQFERRIAELEQQLGQREQQKTKASSRGTELTSFKLTWREGKRAPCGMNRWCDAIVDGNTVYIRYEGTVKIYSYDITIDSWSHLPDCIQNNGSITVVNGCLITVGGRTNRNYSNELFSLTRKGSGRRWTQQFPPMPTKRESTTSLCTGATLIVAGGEGKGSRVLSTVEVMDTETHQWSTAADLPQPMWSASATICGDQLYMLGGSLKDYVSVKSVYTCSVSTLLRSCVKHLRERSPSVYDSVWRQVADLSIADSTCDSLQGQLLAVGGKMDSGKCSTAVQMYNSSTNSWETISHMKTGRYDCFTAVLPDNQLMVVGGYIDGDDSTDVVELASVSMCK